MNEALLMTGSQIMAMKAPVAPERVQGLLLFTDLERYPMTEMIPVRTTRVSAGLVSRDVTPERLIPSPSEPLADTLRPGDAVWSGNDAGNDTMRLDVLIRVNVELMRENGRLVVRSFRPLSSADVLGGLLPIASLCGCNEILLPVIGGDVPV